MSVVRKSLFSFVFLGLVGCNAGMSCSVKEMPIAAPISDAGCSGDVSCTLPHPQPSNSPTGVYEQPTNTACPNDMILVEGMYCTDVKQVCKRYMKEDIGSPYARCEEFFSSKCIGKREHKRFCIERFEHIAKGEALPMVNITFEQAKQVCEADGKRLCKETEWEFAMEGEEMLAYAVSNTRPSDVCNFDHTHLGKVGHIHDLRQSESELAGCKSPFGVISGPGNVDEFVLRDRTPGAHHNALKGGWFSCLRNRVRPATTEHSDTTYSASTCGTRCCKNAL